ncbi:MAG: hypothetical protein AAFY26_03095 [Cyanobacteria bacterium J06638_22]
MVGRATTRAEVFVQEKAQGKAIAHHYEDLWRSAPAPKPHDSLGY